MRYLFCVGLMALAAAMPALAATPAPDMAARWNFKFKDFVIGAWWGPGANDAELQLYRDAGFNVVMSGRYMELDHYGDPDSALRELDLAQRHGLKVLFDTYTKNDRPWGGQPAEIEGHPLHHPASLAELQWLYGKMGHHSALIGFMIGDDQGDVSARADACTRFLYSLPEPRLMPWLCGWIAPQNLVAHNNPIADPQIYPSLYHWDRTAESQAREYCAAYASYGQQCREQGVLFWPMFNVSHNTRDAAGHEVGDYLPSDSLVRFPAYAAVAYGARGIWYFIYNGGAIEKTGLHTTAEEARAALTPIYPVVRRINQRISPWGALVMDRQSAGMFGTAFESGPEWPFPDEHAPAPAGNLWRPGPGKLVRSLAQNLIAGVLTAPRKSPLVMVVDCRVSKSFGDLPAREVSLSFDRRVRSIRVLSDRARRVAGHRVLLTLNAGEGQMLELSGAGLEALTSPAAIQGNPDPRRLNRPFDEQDLRSVRRALLRIDVFGADSGEPYRNRAIELNGHAIGMAPANDQDAWSRETIALGPDQLSWLRMNNEVRIINRGGDAWKFRSVALAVQLPGGAWAKTNSDSTVHSSPHWAYTEGEPWGPDGRSGPIRLSW